MQGRSFLRSGSALTAKAWLDPSPMENIFAFRENHRKPTSNKLIPASLGQIVEQSPKKHIHGKFANTSMFVTFPTANIPALDQDQAPTRIWAPSFWVEGLAPMSPADRPHFGIYGEALLLHVQEPSSNYYPLVVHPDGVEPLKNKMKSRAPRLLTPKMQKWNQGSSTPHVAQRENHQYHQSSNWGVCKNKIKRFQK